MEGKTNAKDLVEGMQQEWEECVKHYRYIHQYPEIGLEEYNTSQYIRQYIQAQQGVCLDESLTQIPTAVIARVINPLANHTILFRCELDALNFKEESGLPFSSKNQLHHACGHDGHMASMLIALKYAAKYRNHLQNSIIFCFQPGEEGKAGASKLFEAKPDLLDGVSHCFALHFHNALYPGTISLSKGPVTALTSRLTITIKGKSSHCMLPHAGIDANMIGSMLVSQLYTLVSQKVPPLEGATLNVFHINGGSLAAKVSDHFQLMASLRVTSMASFNTLSNTITQLTQALCSAYGAQSTIEFVNGSYRPVVNNEQLTLLTRKKLQEGITGLLIEENQKSFAGEDFCEFSQRKPSCYIAVGSALPGSINPLTKESKYPLHSSAHRLNETAFKISTKIWAVLMFM